MYRSFFSVLLLPFLFQTLLRGRVVGVTDGDTFTLLTTEHVQYKIRLHGIDAPEKGQDFGNRSRQALAGLVAGKEVEVQDRGKDRYGRTIGMVFQNGRNINEEMLRQGMAWHYLKYDQDPLWQDIEASAKAVGRGLWAQPGAIAPWAWRKAKREKQYP